MLWAHSNNVNISTLSSTQSHNTDTSMVYVYVYGFVFRKMPSAANRTLFELLGRINRYGHTNKCPAPHPHRFIPMKCEHIEWPNDSASKYVSNNGYQEERTGAASCATRVLNTSMAMLAVIYSELQLYVWLGVCVFDRKILPNRQMNRLKAACSCNRCLFAVWFDSATPKNWIVSHFAHSWHDFDYGEKHLNNNDAMYPMDILFLSLSLSLSHIQPHLEHADSYDTFWHFMVTWCELRTKAYTHLGFLRLSNNTTYCIKPSTIAKWSHELLSVDSMEEFCAYFGCSSFPYLSALTMESIIDIWSAQNKNEMKFTVNELWFG